jgi:hypothetical protein
MMIYHNNISILLFHESHHIKFSTKVFLASRRNHILVLKINVYAKRLVQNLTAKWSSYTTTYIQWYQEQFDLQL